MLDEGQAIVLLNEFTLETFIWIPGAATNSDFYTPIGLNEEPGALRALPNRNKITCSTAGNT
jgi:hypothetical protein